MTGQQLWFAAALGDVAKVRTLLSTHGTQSFINYQDANGCTPLHIVGLYGVSLLRDVTSTSRLSLTLLRCNLGTTESSLIRNRKDETPLLGSREDINGLLAKP